MVLVKILGSIDLTAALAFFSLVSGFEPFRPFFLMISILLFVKGMFIFTGDVLSVVDILASILLFVSLVITIPGIFLWVSAFLLLAKGVVSFI